VPPWIGVRNGDDTLVLEYDKKPTEELTEEVVASYDLTEAILSAHPSMAQDAGFELFDGAWAKRYWRTLVADISGLQAASKIESWAISATISGAATAIATTFGLPAVAFSAAVALAIILIRAARDDVKPD
jgi:hypothetical protein